MTEFSLSLTTAIKPVNKFKVIHEGETKEYEMLGIDHLTPDQEAEVMALFARYALLNAELEQTLNVTKGKDIAKRMKSTRLTMLTKLTTLPKEIAAALPMTQQVRLMEAIEAEVEADADDAEDAPESEDAEDES